MDQLELTPKELLCAAAQLGAVCFYGIADPFFAMTEQELLAETPRLQCSLEKKGYASIDFDGGFTLLDKAETLISIPALCKSYLVANVCLAKELPERLLFYKGENGMAELRSSGETLTLRRIAPSEAAERIWNQMGWRETECPQETVTVPLSVLSQARVIAGSDPVQAQTLLTGAGCPPGIRQILLEGFRKEACYYDISAADLEKRKLEFVICIGGSSGSVRLTPVYGETESSWRFDTVTGAELRESLYHLCGETPPVKGGFQA